VIEVPLKAHSKISKPRVGQSASVENRTRDLRNTKKCHSIRQNENQNQRSGVWSSKSVIKCQQVPATVSSKLSTCVRKEKKRKEKKKSLHPWKCSGTARLHCRFHT